MQNQSNTFKKPLHIVLVIFIILITWLLLFHPDWIIAGPPIHVSAASVDKLDDACTGQETVGRCADKCPNQTDNLLGYDKTTGAAICKQAPTGCPYADSVPLGPECDRLAPQQAVYNDPQLVAPETGIIQGK